MGTPELGHPKVILETKLLWNLNRSRQNLTFSTPVAAAVGGEAALRSAAAAAAAAVLGGLLRQLVPAVVLAAWRDVRAEPAESESARTLLEDLSRLPRWGWALRRRRKLLPLLLDACAHHLSAMSAPPAPPAAAAVLPRLHCTTAAGRRAALRRFAWMTRWVGGSSSSSSSLLSSSSSAAVLAVVHAGLVGPPPPSQTSRALRSLRVAAGVVSRVVSVRVRGVWRCAVAAARAKARLLVWRAAEAEIDPSAMVQTPL
jgi:hypothetical protein